MGLRRPGMRLTGPDRYHAEILKNYMIDPGEI